MGPITDQNRLRQLSATPIEESIPGDVLSAVLASPPFIHLPGSLNLRDIGLFASQYVRPGLIFRSGTLDFIAEDARPLLRSQLRLSKVYDLRRLDEVKRPVPDVEGMQVLSRPYMDGAEMPPPTVAADFAPNDDGTRGMGYTDMYETILRGYTGGFRDVLRGLLALSDDDAILFHCTAGRDRTGVMAALILDLMSTPAELIGAEYVLTRIGVEPFREQLMPALLESVVGASKGDGRAREGETRGASGWDTPGMRELLGPDAQTIEVFVAHLRAVHGGAEGYIKNKLGLSDAEVEALKAKLAP